MDASNVSSIYAATQGVPLILAPQFSSLKPISLPHDFDLSGDLPPMPQPCDFELERSVINQLERERQAAALKVAIRSEKIRMLHEERIQKQKAEARKIAPGFLDTDRRILTPEPVANSQHPRSDELPNHVVERLKLKTEEDKLSATVTKTINPWDLSNTIEDDKNETNTAAPFNVNNIEIRQSHQQQEAPQPLLRQGGYPTTSIPMNNYNPQNTTTTNSSFTITTNNDPRTLSNPSSPNSSSQLYSPAQYLTTPIQITPTTTNTGSFSRGRSASHSSAYTTTTIIPPSRPPKELPRSRSTSPIITNTNSNSNSSLANPEKLFHENNENPEALKQLVNMGFSREQAIDALKKYDNDLVKATNYLLDN
ncbi:1546_t:CDS:2 [Ambispora gerdemannii]|uniref:1546_t:CDS:1 n=1 Tax=Ambispora gerdemannii TaxID=144530 RepID=A0A9N8WGW7_9GLOM|nr:1546_t:CDS:2 [Ambispora gerdemannii]